MTLLATLILAQAPATAADFFPLTPGLRRTYEQKGSATTRFVFETGVKPVYFDDAPAIGVVQRSPYNETLGTNYYRIDGATVLMVGIAEDRRGSTPTLGGTVDFTKQQAKANVLMQLQPAMPVFKYEGKETNWDFGGVPRFVAPGEESVKQDKTLISGTAKPGKVRTVLGHKVETLDVRAEVTLGEGNLAVKIVETSVYGRGIGLIESLRKETSNRKTTETRTTLIGLETPKEGG